MSARTTSYESIFLRAALAYARRGWYVFPLAPHSKKPIANSAGVLDATTNELQIRAWWEGSPSANVGIATGKSGLVVIDIDGPEGTASLMKWTAEHGQLPWTVTAYTPSGGMHYLFSYKGDDLAPGADIFGKGSKVDVRAGNSYIAAPPSLHPDFPVGPDAVYKWDKEAHPADMQPAELPAALRDVLTAKPPITGVDRSSDEPELIETGQDEYGARQAAVLARKGFSKEEARAALSAMIETRFAGGWTGLDARRPWKPQDVERWLKGAYEKFYDPDAGDMQTDELEAVNDLLGSLIERQAVKQKTPTAATFTAAELQGEEIAPIKWIVTDLLPEGVSIFGGKPKTGKSWLALGLALAIAGDEPIFDRPVVKGGEVLYLALEDNKRRLQSRLNKIMGKRKWPTRFHFALDWPRGGDAVKKLDEWLIENPETVLVIVDTLAKVKTPGGDDGYSQDYAIVSAYAKLTQERQFSILIVTHQRKMAADDPIDTLQGTLGVSGAADTFYALTRQKLGADATLYYRGREIESSELPIRWDSAAGLWMLREVTGVSGTRGKIVEALEAGLFIDGATPSQIAEASGLDADTVRHALPRMVKDGQLLTVGYGKYRLPTEAETPDEG